MAVPEKIGMENVNHPGRVVRVEAAKYNAVLEAVLSVLPSQPPGLTLVELREAVRPLVSGEVLPDGFKAGWWVMGIQLDLRAKQVIATENSKPLRLYRSTT
ncbi:DUF6958 family protein [Acidisphaera sp. S103]|uniref:DUF6958 family protein n=1 Tax=Acidisphaera sp. S103 TaxID=1747223 RepID=UPI00131C0A2B|nr:hypothetical protein [Acidisphaera sp. S103]